MRRVEAKERIHAENMIFWGQNVSAQAMLQSACITGGVRIRDRRAGSRQMSRKKSSSKNIFKDTTKN